MISLGTYQHYKGHRYRVHAIARHSEQDELLVVYEALYPNPASRFFVRPITSFTEPVRWPDDSLAPRFKLLQPLLDAEFETQEPFHLQTETETPEDDSGTV